MSRGKSRHPAKRTHRVRELAFSCRTSSIGILTASSSALWCTVLRLGISAAPDQGQNSRFQCPGLGTGGRRVSPALHGLSEHERENETRASVPLLAPANAPFDLPTRCAVQQSSGVVVCGSVGNSAVTVSGGAAALPAQAPRECAVRFARAIRRARLDSSRRASIRVGIHLAHIPAHSRVYAVSCFRSPCVLDEQRCFSY